MTLFPQIDTQYYDQDDRTVHEMIEYYYASSIQIQQSFWSESDIDSRFVAGDQTLWNDIYGNLPAFRRRQFNFNRIRRIRNMIGGYQRQHRKSTVVTPVHNKGEIGADQFSKLMIDADRRMNFADTFSQAFEGGAIDTGMNLLSFWMDYREDPVNGDIKCDNVSYNEYLIDPFFKKHDLSDCRFIWTRKWLSKIELKSILPDQKDLINSMYARGWRDGKFQFQPEAYNYAMQDLLSYDEFFYLDYRSRKLLVDVESGETLEWKYDEESMSMFARSHPQIKVIDQIIPTVKLAIMVNGRTMYHGRNPMGIDRYPFAAMLGYYSPQIPYFPYRCQGVVRGLRDAQYLYNRRKIIELDILESQINSGVKYKEDSLVDPKSVFMQGQGRQFALKKEAEMTDVEFISAPAIPSSMFQLSEIMGREIMEISGVNEELLGSATDEKAGILSMLRQGAGLTTLQILFDQADFTQKVCGEIKMELMQANYTPGKIRRIIGEEPAPEFYSKVFAEYDCAVEEGLDTTTQRQMNFAQMLQLREVLGDMITPEDLLESATLQNKRELVEKTQARSEQSSQMAQEQHQMAMALQQAQIKNLQAQSTANEGLGIERVARVQENRALAVERLAEAENQRAMSVYNELKALKELEAMDEKSIVDLMGLLHTIEESHRNRSEREQMKGEASEATAAQAVAEKSN